MKKFIAMGVAAAAFLLSPALVAIDGSVAEAHHTKKDRAYWTRVWYKKRGLAVPKKASYRRSSKPVRTGRGRIKAIVDKSQQKMRVYQGGRHLYTWAVSTGRKGYGTPTGTWSVKRMHREYYSKKYDGAPMPHSLFYNGGFAVHGTYSVKRLGRPASHGCVRLAPNNARRLYNLVERHGGTVKVKY